MNNLSFVKDERVKILEPRATERVTLPVTLEWTAGDFTGSFGVFFDSATPMRPGADLLSLVPGTDPCRQRPDCPDPQWLADRLIYVTDRPRLVVDTLPDRSGRRTTVDPHEVTIVLLDAGGRRVGESAFIREFVIERDGR